MMKKIHVGEALRAWCKRNNLTRQKLADLVELPKSNIDRVFSKPSIETSKLADFSRRLNHNFFAEFWSDRSYDDLKKENGFMETPPESLNIGTSIWSYMLGNHIPQNKLATALGVTHPVVSKLLKKESIDTEKLVDISNFLNRDFFVEFYMLHRMKGMKETPDSIIPVGEDKNTDPLKAVLNRNEVLAAEIALLKEKVKSQQLQIGQLEKGLGTKVDTTFNEPFVKIDQPISSELLGKLKILAEQYNIDLDTFIYLAINKGIEMLADKYKSVDTK